jgi:hypothetical protein
MRSVIRLALIAIALGISGWAGSSCSPSNAVLAEVELDPRATYLRTFQDPALPAEPIALDSLGIQPGDEIRIEAVGGWDNGKGGELRGAGAVFSTSRELLPGDSLNRVPGALPVSVAPAYGSWETYYGGRATDVPQDFSISSDETGQDGVTVTVPDGSRFLFVTAMDYLFNDNGPGPEGWGIRILSGS